MEVSTPTDVWALNESVLIHYAAGYAAAVFDIAVAAIWVAVVVGFAISVGVAVAKEISKVVHDMYIQVFKKGL